jgi:hypothetical protein
MKLRSMKLKDRFKKAVFNFFKQEIMEQVGYFEPFRHTEVVNKEYVFQKVEAEIRLSSSQQYLTEEPLDSLYARAVEECKSRLFEECMKYAQIDVASVLKHSPYRDKAIRVTLYVGQPKH